MKMKMLRVIILCLLSTSIGFGQCIEQNQDGNSPPCNGTISTNPANPVNTERASMLNHFDWKPSFFNVNHPAGGYSGANSQIVSPFHTDAPFLSNLNYYKYLFSERTPDNLDFYPEDGWELIHKGNGYQVDEVTPFCQPMITG